MNELFLIPEKIKKENFLEINEKSKKYKHYIKAKQELEDQYKIENIIEIINNSKLTDKYINSMKEFNTDILYKSDGHGLNHNIRVAFNAYIISSNENISEDDFLIIMDACKYHDIGRKNDLEDKLHGTRSSEMLSFIEDKYTKEELNYLKTIIICHSLNDKDFEKVAIKNKIKDIKRCKKMHEILKDSDGLDRVRLHYPYVNIKYIRTETAKKMITFSHELYYNYNMILDNTNVNN